MTQFDEETVFAQGMDEVAGIIERDLITNHPLLRPSPFAPQLANNKYPTESQILIESETSYSSLTTVGKVPGTQGQPASNVGMKGDASIFEDDKTSGYSSMAPQSVLSETVGSIAGGGRVVNPPKDNIGGIRPKSATLKAIEEKVFGVEEEDEDLYIQDDDEGIDLDDTS